MTFNTNIFNEIKGTLAKADNNFKDILKFEPGKTYQVRLVPDVKNPRGTINHYFHHSWKSLQTGRFITHLCPTTYGEACPIDQYLMKTFNAGEVTTAEKTKLQNIYRNESFLVNAYVISDPTNPDNEGKVKIIRYGKELAKIINSAIDGDDADEFGAKIFDVQTGSTLRIKCESRANSTSSSAKKYTTYSSSKFLTPSKIDVDVDKIYNAIHDLTKLSGRRVTTAELQKSLEQHYHCIQDAPEITDDEYQEETNYATPAATKSTINIDEIFKGVETAGDPVELSEEDAGLKELLDL
jgi:hypothetical protein